MGRRDVMPAPGAMIGSAACGDGDGPPDRRRLL